MEPNAPPVMMMGPSAPKGPPEPMAMAEEIGLRMATRGWRRLPLMRMASSASGMPCPRMRSEPQRAMAPTTSAPAMGTMRMAMPRSASAGEASEVFQR